MYTHRRLTCLTPEPSDRLDGKQTVIVIVVLILGVALAVTGMPVVVMAEVLTACGLIGTHLARRAATASEAL